MVTSDHFWECKIKKIKPKYLLHCAGLSRPMKLHDNFISKSIDLNIIGTANIVKVCSEFNECIQTCFQIRSFRNYRRIKDALSYPANTGLHTARLRSRNMN